MRRFRWPLQRLLDVTAQRELAQRAELLRLSRDMAGLRQEIVRRRRIIRASLKELSGQALEARIPQQEVVMVCAAVRERQIRRFRQRLEALEAQRKDKIAQLIKTKNSRESLEKMRERARQVPLRQELKLEQKQLDERAHVSFAHKARRGEPSTGSVGDRND